LSRKSARLGRTDEGKFLSSCGSRNRGREKAIVTTEGDGRNPERATWRDKPSQTRGVSRSSGRGLANPKRGIKNTQKKPRQRPAKVLKGHESRGLLTESSNC